MSEYYRKQIEDAVQTVRWEEGRGTFSEADAKGRIQWHVEHNFAESLKGKGTMPVPDSIFKLLKWACYEYCFKLLQELRRQDAVAEHEGRQKRANA